MLTRNDEIMAEAGSKGHKMDVTGVTGSIARHDAVGTRVNQGRGTTHGGFTMATTDYDAPRRSTVEESDTESLDALTTARKEAQSPDVDLDEADTAEAIELPGADLSGEELTMPVIPKQADEFTCGSCFLVQHRSRIATTVGGQFICIDCA